MQVYTVPFWSFLLRNPWLKTLTYHPCLKRPLKGLYYSEKCTLGGLQGPLMGSFKTHTVLRMGSTVTFVFVNCLSSCLPLASSEWAAMRSSSMPYRMESLLNLLSWGSRKATGNVLANDATHSPRAGRCLKMNTRRGLCTDSVLQSLHNVLLQICTLSFMSFCVCFSFMFAKCFIVRAQQIQILILYSFIEFSRLPCSLSTRNSFQNHTKFAQLTFLYCEHLRSLYLVLNSGLVISPSVWPWGAYH